MSEQDATPDNQELGPECTAVVPYVPHGTAVTPIPHARREEESKALEAVIVDARYEDQADESGESRDESGRGRRGRTADQQPRRAASICGARTKSSGNPCSKVAGWRTEHPGQGRCYLHGGKTPITHGRYSTVQRARVSELLDELAEDPDPMDLIPEVQLLRALVLDYVERHDALTDAVMAWHESFSTGENEPKPRAMPDILSVGKFIENIGGLVERIHKQKQTGTITLETLNRVLEQVGVELVAAAQEAIADAAVRTRFLDIAERRVGSIAIEPNGARNGPRKGNG